MGSELLMPSWIHECFMVPLLDSIYPFFCVNWGYAYHG